MPRPKSEATHKLEDMQTQETSLVDVAANGRTFFFAKSADREEVAKLADRGGPSTLVRSLLGANQAFAKQLQYALTAKTVNEQLLLIAEAITDHLEVELGVVQSIRSRNKTEKSESTKKSEKKTMSEKNTNEREDFNYEASEKSLTLRWSEPSADVDEDGWPADMAAHVAAKGAISKADPEHRLMALFEALSRGVAHEVEIVSQVRDDLVSQRAANPYAGRLVDQRLMNAINLSPAELTDRKKLADALGLDVAEVI